MGFRALTFAVWCSAHLFRLVGTGTEYSCAEWQSLCAHCIGVNVWTGLKALGKDAAGELKHSAAPSACYPLGGLQRRESL